MTDLTKQDANWISYDLRATINPGAAPSGRVIYGLENDNAFVPTKQDTYVLPAFGGDILAIMPGEPYIYIYGPTGCGKTSCVKFIAATFHLPVYEVTGHSRLEFPELVGSYKLVNQNMVWVDGPLTLALRNGGIFLLNEQSLVDPATAAGLNTILDGSPLLIPETGELVQQHREFRFIATDNTNGSGDDTGLYNGTLRQNAALMGRFAFIKADYLPRQVEERILSSQVPNLPAELGKKILDYAAEVRSGGDTLSITMSPRDYIRWGKFCLVFEPLQKRGISPARYALERAFLFRAPQPEQDTLYELFQRVFGTDGK